MKRRLSVTNFSSENNLFSELKLVTDNLKPTEKLPKEGGGERSPIKDLLSDQRLFL